MFDVLLAISLRAVAMNAGINAPHTRMPHIGARCGTAPFAASRALGDPLPANEHEGDIPGPAGNEIRQIYRIYARADGKQIGWLFRSFDNRYAFEATAPELQFGVLALRGSQAPPPYKVNSWIREMETSLHRRVGAAYRRSLAGDRVVLRACFAPEWNGVDRSSER